MSTERHTQNRVVALFCDTLAYTHLGDCRDRANNSNVEPDLLAALKDAESHHINCECPTCDGDTGQGCSCVRPTQWRAAIAKAEGR